MTPKPKRPETAYDRLKMPEIQAILGLPHGEVLRLMFKGQLRYIRKDGKRQARRGDVLACKAKLAVPAIEPK